MLMTKTNCAEIKMKDEINTNLGTNISARNLFKKLNDSSITEFILDFTGIIIMSRSFTQEYISKK